MSRTTPTFAIRLACRWFVNRITPMRWPNCAQATNWRPDNARYAYVYAIALNTSAAIRRRWPCSKHPPAPSGGSRRAPALVSIAREAGDFATALLHARELAALYPTDVQLGLLIRDLEQRQAQ